MSTTLCKTIAMKGTPLYITDVEVFKENIITFRNALKAQYGNVRIGYSFKTNYQQCFLNAVKELGEMAEIVSPMEYRKATHTGFSPKDIIYNGVIPDGVNKIFLAQNGGIVHFDNIEELKQASIYAGETETHIGVRLNFDMRTGVVSRFGIDVENVDDMTWLVDKSEHPYIIVDKLHCHYSGARSLNDFRRRVETMAHYGKLFSAKSIDIGGNMFGVLEPEFDSQFEDVVPSLEEYAYVIGSTMKHYFPAENVTLIVEGGTPFVTNAMHLLTTITSVKEIRDKKFVTVDCRNEDVGWTCRYKEPVVRSMCSGEPELYTINGCECTETDVIRHAFYGAVTKGGMLLVRDIGAYSSNLSNEFISPACSNFVDISTINDRELLPK